MSEGTDLTWRHEESPTWDSDKRRVVGSAPAGVFSLDYRDDQALPGDWWTASTAAGHVVGYGWLDATWGGDAEILLAVEDGRQQQGVGSFVLAHLEAEASRRGLNYVYNTVRSAHPRRDDLHDWLAVRGYRGADSPGSDTALRKRVGADAARQDVADAPSRATPAPSREATTGRTAYHPGGEGDRAPGHEESGGYVDVEEHRY